MAQTQCPFLWGKRFILVTSLLWRYDMEHGAWEGETRNLWIIKYWAPSVYLLAAPQGMAERGGAKPIYPNRYFADTDFGILYHSSCIQKVQNLREKAYLQKIRSDQKRIHTQPNRLISKIENYWSFIFAGNQVPGTFLRRRKLKLRPLNVEMFNFSSSSPSPKSIPMPLPAAVYFQTHADSIFPDRNLLAQSSAHTQLFPSIELMKSKY